MDDDGTDTWSAIAGEWHHRWGTFAAPAWAAVLDAVGLEPPGRVLDVGCGSGDLVAHLQGLGHRVAGVDPAPGMLAVARTLAPAADLRRAEAASLPFDDDSFDLAIAVNALHLADEGSSAVAEMARVVVPGGHVAVVTWAERVHNELDVIERALADDPEPAEPGAGEGSRVADELEALLTGAGLTAVAGGLVAVPWEPSDDDALVRGILLGEDAATLHEVAPTVIDAARRFRRDDGSYRLVNHLRLAVGCVGGPSR